MPPAPARVCGVAGGVRGGGFAGRGGPGAGSAPRCTGVRARRACGADASVALERSATCPPAASRRTLAACRRPERLAPVSEAQPRGTVGLLFPETQWGPCAGCGLSEQRWEARAAPHRPSASFRAPRGGWGPGSGRSRPRAAWWALAAHLSWEQPAWHFRGR